MAYANYNNKSYSTYGSWKWSKPHSMETAQEMRERIMKGNYTKYEIKRIVDLPESEYTTVNMGNVPYDFTRDNMLDLLHEYEYIECVDFVHLPMKSKTDKVVRNLGFALINFTSTEDAVHFKTMFTGFTDWFGLNSGRNLQSKCSLEWSHPMQGLAAHVDKFCGIRARQHMKEESHYPALLLNGRCIELPNMSQKMSKKQHSYAALERPGCNSWSSETMETTEEEYECVSI